MEGLWVYWRAARRARGEIAGLTGLMLRAFLLNALILFAAIALVAWLLVSQVLEPGKAYLQREAPPLLAASGVLLLWLVLFTLLFLISFLILRSGVALMELWSEALVARVVNHFRPVKDRPLSFKGLALLSRATIGELIWSLFLTLLLLLLALIPLLGGVLAFLVGSYFLGRSLHGPYRAVLSSQGWPVELPQPLLRFNLQFGALHLALPLIPLLGWLLAPYSLLQHMIGLAYLMEQRAWEQGKLALDDRDGSSALPLL
jgi:uncharacterized protein involved in cysteine biosynthesis